MTTATKERPILFSGEMVRAILDDRKTQTRRVMKPSLTFGTGMKQRRNRAGNLVWCETNGKLSLMQNIRCPYGAVGDALWVREKHQIGWPCEDGEPDRWDEDGNELPKHVWYAATPDASGGWTSNRGAHIEGWFDYDKEVVGAMKWRSPIFMPRWASRITLEITDIRVHRLQDTTEADAEAEGFESTAVLTPEKDDYCGFYAVEHFEESWDRINAKRGFGWSANPWVWVVEFRRVEK